jgi:branched-chain amino acid transport system ATP-binding protein
MIILKLENISTGFGKKQVLFNVSYELEQGEVCLLIGGNGSGKSTLLKAIYHLLPLWTGVITFDGENSSGLLTSDLLKKGLVYIPQQNALFEQLTVQENLEMAGLSLSNNNLLKARIDAVLTTFPMLIAHLTRTPFKMSGGERKILSLAMAILHRPKLILIDEPFTGLSNQNIIFVREAIRRLNKEGVTFLIIEHRIKESLDIAQRIIGLKLGRVMEIYDVSSGQMPNVQPIFV